MTAPFAVNDKVVRTGSWVNPRCKPRTHPNGVTSTGVVYCVTDCWYNPVLGHWQMSLAGFPALLGKGFQIGFCCANFRKVDDLIFENMGRKLAELANS